MYPSCRFQRGPSVGRVLHDVILGTMTVFGCASCGRWSLQLPWSIHFHFSLFKYRLHAHKLQAHSHDVRR
ncbi:hypothetical protein M758_12G024900 [Ceratodon purpureus]|uniref:Uncharacterized protein n=1 Tax=Ceratodon purpureus TaxID=3225 RepID=A0A8T0G6V6_CERPU|nr:hypothetical protein KC19_12G025000 [Ceratodon purpureus]KAG0597846.1 hypothetical protein M758_12G024900 [Ceratodon purpureus]